MLKIEDFSEAKVDKFGKYFLQIVTEFCKDNDIKCDCFPDVDIDQVSGTTQKAELWIRLLFKS